MGQSASVGASFEQDISELPNNYFNRQELRKLWVRFHQLSNNEKYLQKRQLNQIPELQLNPLADRIADLFVDQPDKESISFNSFITCLSVFNHQASEEEKLRFLFRVYDRDGDGKITEDELFLILKQCVGNNIEEAQLKMLVSGTMADANKTGEKTLDYQEFAACVQRNNAISEKLTVKF